MKTTSCSISALLLVCTATCFAQVSGNSAYSQIGGSARAEQAELNKRNISHDELPPNGSSTLIEASVLMNVKADEYVAVFGVTQEGATVAECGNKMDATLRAFSDALKQLGIGSDDVFVDFVTQNRTYEYEVTGSIAKEQLTGFELKKNVSIHYKDLAMLDKLVVAASNQQIFDLIKVDYIVKDTTAVHSRLEEEASRIIKLKATRYERLLGIKLAKAAQVYSDKPSIYYPTEMYDSYTAFESGDVNAGYFGQKYIIQNARKSQTFYFNALSAKGFDYVDNPVVIGPVVQFTLYLKVRYETAASSNSSLKKSK